MNDRYYCEACGEIYHEENIEACERCGKLLCPYCVVSTPRRPPDPLPEGYTDEYRFLFEGTVWLCSLTCEGTGDSDGHPFSMDTGEDPIEQMMEVRRRAQELKARNAARDAQQARDPDAKQADDQSEE